MKITSINIGVALILFVCASLPVFSDVNPKSMEAAEKLRNEKASEELVAYMSLPTMFPDAAVRSLAEAAGNGDLSKIEQLVKSGVDVNARGSKNATPLFWALRNYNGFEKLIELGANPNVVFGNGFGGSVIGRAVRSKDDRFLRVVLQHGGNPNLVDNELGYTPLFIAINSNGPAIDALLAVGADINATDYIGNTPAMVAAGVGKFKVVHQLLHHGAAFQVKNKYGETLASRIKALSGAMDPKHESAQWMNKVIEYLRGKGVEITTSSK